MSDSKGTSVITPSRPTGFEERYRLYLDESGDHVFREVDEPQHRFLCLLGCWFRNPEYLLFHQSVEQFKARNLPHHPRRAGDPASGGHDQCP
ncbi:MAG: DUF3800 domain-containing protein [Planctomycetes bacterium]|nr:DUF3800 domain-containing protein [Planctomycetota bacterium]MBM4083770.1 DUF3800 domain-containing protein [Planctomycetota bacterium]